jgi:hypothetical protein
MLRSSCNFVVCHDDQESAAFLVQRAAELDEALRYEAVDERGVSRSFATSLAHSLEVYR